jgi:hypothetical protein
VKSVNVPAFCLPEGGIKGRAGLGISGWPGLADLLMIRVQRER